MKKTNSAAAASVLLQLRLRLPHFLRDAAHLREPGAARLRQEHRVARRGETCDTLRRYAAPLPVQGQQFVEPLPLGLVAARVRFNRRDRLDHAPARTLEGGELRIVGVKQIAAQGAFLLEQRALDVADRGDRDRGVVRAPQHVDEAQRLPREQPRQHEHRERGHEQCGSQGSPEPARA
jgi:hypothetical protein